MAPRNANAFVVGLRPMRFARGSFPAVRMTETAFCDESVDMLPLRVMVVRRGGCARANRVYFLAVVLDGELAVP